jgi:hypothetical protein
MPFDIIFLDAGGTLVWPNWDRVRETLRAHGIEVDAGSLAAADPFVRRSLDEQHLIAAASDLRRGWNYLESVLARAGVALTPTAQRVSSLEEYPRTLKLDQHGRRFRVKTEEIRSRALMVITMFAFALVLGFADHLFPLAQRGLPLWLLLFSTLLGGGSGAAIRMVFQRRHGVGPLVTSSITVTLGLGMFSGGLTELLYLVSQPGDVILTQNSPLRLISIVTVVAAVAGPTAETVFRNCCALTSCAPRRSQFRRARRRGRCSTPVSPLRSIDVRS